MSQVLCFRLTHRETHRLKNFSKKGSFRVVFKGESRVTGFALGYGLGFGRKRLVLSGVTSKHVERTCITTSYRLFSGFGPKFL